MALLTSIVRKEALLPEHTAAFAATQLLPVIQAAVQSNMAAKSGDPESRVMCKELLVSANVTATNACRRGSCMFATCSC